MDGRHIGCDRAFIWRWMCVVASQVVAMPLRALKRDQGMVAWMRWLGPIAPPAGSVTPAPAQRNEPNAGFAKNPI